MSLVIGKIIENKLFFESDSKVSNEQLVNENDIIAMNVLKVVIISPHVCIAFAGKVYYAEMALKEIFDRKEAKLIEMLQILSKYNLTSIKMSNGNTSEETDFIVGAFCKNGPQLIKIINGQMITGSQSVWIGDLTGFKCFQKHFLKKSDHDTNELNRFRTAFSEVISDEVISSIGNFQIEVETSTTICPGNQVFLYNLSVEINRPASFSVTIKEANVWQPINLGSAQTGDYSFSKLISVSEKYHGIAFHFPYVNMGILFCPSLNFEGMKIQGKTGKEFIEFIRDKYEIPMQGLVQIDEYSIQFLDTRDL